MPAGIARPPGGIPFQSLIFKFGFGEPENKVILIPFVGVFLYAFPYADGEILFIEIVEDVIAVKL